MGSYGSEALASMSFDNGFSRLEGPPSADGGATPIQGAEEAQNLIAAPQTRVTRLWHFHRWIPAEHSLTPPV
jgi:hypothetical protein